ncbi:F0F1 ATP synthase subunit delta [Abyssisolibacter fermentans]|uniref:F0F1 ATP synthase subunit delta n=1 Tax=Abyssisolibacter fermentans TaxID=1766203 RepID=UPI00083008F6|nr:F0F1 ATP synthase subunit delta [Abyssisolibacter fermentans]
MAQLVGKRYAEALFEVALEMDKLNEFKEEISSINDIFQSEPKLKVIFEHPKLSKNEKKDIVDALLKKQASKEILNFMYIIIDKGREKYLDDIKKEYIQLSNKEQGIIEAKAITAIEMTKDEILKLQDNLSKKLNSKVILQNIIDDNIMGGVLVRIGDRVIDASVKGQLNEIQGILNSIKVAKIGVKN